MGFRTSRAFGYISHSPLARFVVQAEELGIGQFFPSAFGCFNNPQQAELLPLRGILRSYEFKLYTVITKQSVCETSQKTIDSSDKP